MRILLSIKPKYAEAIFSGYKKIEFRKTPIRQNISEALIYMSRTKKKIIGAVSITKIIESSPENLWECFGNIGGIDKKNFFEYFQGKEKGFALLLEDPILFPEEEHFKPDYVPSHFVTFLRKLKTAPYTLGGCFYKFYK